MYIFFLQGKVYLFDKVFKPNASQEKVYNEAAKSIVSGQFTFKNKNFLYYFDNINKDSDESDQYQGIVIFRLSCGELIFKRGFMIASV